jgi:hypothetical protein
MVLTLNQQNNRIYSILSNWTSEDVDYKITYIAVFIHMSDPHLCLFHYLDT